MVEQLTCVPRVRKVVSSNSKGWPKHTQRCKRFAAASTSTQVAVLPWRYDAEFGVIRRVNWKVWLTPAHIENRWWLSYRIFPSARSGPILCHYEPIVKSRKFPGKTLQTIVFTYHIATSQTIVYTIYGVAIQIVNSLEILERTLRISQPASCDVKIGPFHAHCSWIYANSNNNIIVCLYSAFPHSDLKAIKGFKV